MSNNLQPVASREPVFAAIFPKWLYLKASRTVGIVNRFRRPKQAMSVGCPEQPVPLSFPKIRGMRVRKSTDFLLRLRPWSPTAFALALLATIAASVVQEAVASLGVPLHFAIFFLAIIVVSLLAGAPAGTSAAALAIPIVWWEFLPPQFEFSPLTGADYHHFAIFLLFSALAISACNLYREALAILRSQDPAASGGFKRD
jgi:hypothetical protein